MDVIALLGVACSLYWVAEVALAAGRARPTTRFGAVDASTGRPIAMVVDRRCGRDAAPRNVRADRMA